MGVLARTPYDAGFVDELKRTVPVPDRYWDGDGWWVALDGVDTLTELLLEYFDAYTILDGDGLEEDTVARAGVRTRQERFL